MKIEFYKTGVCPRCMLAQRELNRVLQDKPDIALETIEISTNLMRTWKAGVRLFPALKIGDDILAGVLLSEEKINQFIAQQH
ncbi:MAG: hypothetical protein RBR22_01100 [Desulfuromonas sp.]|nr:hypothetical protein [Desulfuromonas sp.]